MDAKLSYYLWRDMSSRMCAKRLTTGWYS